MDENNLDVAEDGDSTQIAEGEPSVLNNQKLEGNVRKKRRRGKSKRKVTKPFSKIPWQDRRKIDQTQRNNRFRKIVLSKTHAPFNNNQFLMEIHKPEPVNPFHLMRTPSARTRDSSFSIDSEDNYFFSLPEDEEEYLTKEFSSVYEDAQSERLSNMSKDDLIQEYLLLEAKYDNLVKRTERSRFRCNEEDKDVPLMDKDASLTDKDSMLTDKDTSGTSTEESSTVEDHSYNELMQRMREQDEQLLALQLENERLKSENEHLRQQSPNSSSEDSESDSSSSSDSDSSSSKSASEVDEPIVEENNLVNGNHALVNGHCEEEEEDAEVDPVHPVMNGYHDPTE